MTGGSDHVLNRAAVARLLGVGEGDVDRLVTDQRLRISGHDDRFELGAIAEYLATSGQVASQVPESGEGAPRSRRRGPYKPPGVARELKSRKEKKGRRADGKLTGRWIAVYVDLEGKTREAGLRRSETLAASMISPTELTRPKLDLARKAMQDAGLNRKTIADADAFAAMSRLLRKLAVSDPSIVDHARGIRVVGKPPTYKPKLKQKYRAREASEVHYFINEYVAPDDRPVFWTPAITGARFAECLAINWHQRTAAEQTITLHETVDRNGHLVPGLKTSHHRDDDEDDTTTTLFPDALARMYERKGIPLDGYLARTAEGNFFSHRNFYRDLWDNKPGCKREGPMTRYERDGGKRFTAQDLRTCFSSWLADAGVPQWIIDTWMGHSDPTHESMLGTQRRGSVLTRHYLQEMGSWRPVAQREHEEGSGFSYPGGRRQARAEGRRPSRAQARPRRHRTL